MTTIRLRLPHLATLALSSWAILGVGLPPGLAQSAQTPSDPTASKQPRVVFEPGGTPSLQYPGITSTPKDGQHIFTIMPSVPATRTSPAIPSTIVKRIAALGPGGPIPNTHFWFTYSIVPFSGGHDHDDADRPKGTMDPVEGFSGADGWLDVTFTAPEVGGELRIDTRLMTPWGAEGSGTDYASYKIDLVPISVGTLVGSTPTHVSNHWGMPSLQLALQDAYAMFQDMHPGAPFPVNDASLVGGGLFDVTQPPNWRPPHHEHRWGSNVDFDYPALSLAQQRDLHRIFIGGDFDVLKEPDKRCWHLTVRR